ncbi:hypothetical protein M422DRAFT_157913, partial [Sphaerobolus stellatus SS14]
ESISDFFSKAKACTTRSQCDVLASNTFGGPIKPVPHQGVFSYTVAAANDTVIYFNISLAIPDDGLDHQLTTVRSLARFFAQSWQNRSPPDPNTIPTISADCYSSFDYLSTNLPDRFQVTITQVQKGLPTLFSGKYPLVVTHGDLSEMNILADPATGEIAGIIDWAEAGIQPFGFALYALDNILGYLTLNEWAFHGTAEYLRDEFWRVFRELVGGVSGSEMEFIQLAKLAGLFLRYGIPYKSGRKGVVGVGGPNSTSIKILDALVLG